MVVDLGDSASYYVSSSTGQAGNMGSPHFLHNALGKWFREEPVAGAADRRVCWSAACKQQHVKPYTVVVDADKSTKATNEL